MRSNWFENGLVTTYLRAGAIGLGLVYGVVIGQYQYQYLKSYIVFNRVYLINSTDLRSRNLFLKAKKFREKFYMLLKSKGPLHIYLTIVNLLNTY